jgi:diaminopimelate decarboxylase
MPPVKAGDILVFRTAGAYGAAMSSEYNSRLRVPEVMINGSDFAVVRLRGTYEELIDRYTLPPWLEGR